MTYSRGLRFFLQVCHLSEYLTTYELAIVGWYLALSNEFVICWGKMFMSVVYFGGIDVLCIIALLAHIGAARQLQTNVA